MTSKKDSPKNKSNKNSGEKQYIIASDIKHDGKFYKKGSECPAKLFDLFAQKGFIE